MNWQPIETAPMDGESRIIIYDGSNGYITIATYDEVYAPDFGGQSHVWRDDSDRDFCGWQTPTHWMPLPEPPESR